MSIVPPASSLVSLNESRKSTTSALRSGWYSFTCRRPRRALTRQLTRRRRSPGTCGAQVGELEPLAADAGDVVAGADVGGGRPWQGPQALDRRVHADGHRRLDDLLEPLEPQRARRPQGHAPGHDIRPSAGMSSSIGTTTGMPGIEPDHARRPSQRQPGRRVRLDPQGAHGRARGGELGLERDRAALERAHLFARPPSRPPAAARSRRGRPPAAGRTGAATATSSGRCRPIAAHTSAAVSAA